MTVLHSDKCFVRGQSTVKIPIRLKVTFYRSEVANFRREFTLYRSVVVYFSRGYTL
jgi:hypothetical protein